MSTHDLFVDGFPHGTPEGFDAGCRGAGCPAELAIGMSCKKAKTLSRGDYRYQKLAKSGRGAEPIAIELGLHPTLTTAALLAETGRQLASEREDLIAAGADPAELLVPAHPDLDPEPTPEIPAPETTSPEQHTQEEPDMPTAKRSAGAAQAGTIRAWATSAGIHVPARGRVPNTAIKAYNIAHGLEEPETPEEPTPDPITPAEHEEIALAAAEGESERDETESPDDRTSEGDEGPSAAPDETRDPESATIVAPASEAPPAAAAPRPDWSEVTISEDVERARNHAVNLATQLAHTEGERDAALAAAAQAEQAIMIVLLKWDTILTRNRALEIQLAAAEAAVRAARHATAAIGQIRLRAARQRRKASR